MYQSNWSRSHSARKVEKGESKVWDEWTDILGQTYKPGDYVAVAIINGRSPQMVIAQVEKINRVDSKGALIEETRFSDRECTPDTPGAKQYPNGTWHVREIETRPSCTVKAKPQIDARGFYRTGVQYRADEPVKSVTYQIWQNILAVDQAMVDRLADETAADLEALRQELGGT